MVAEKDFSERLHDYLAVCTLEELQVNDNKEFYYLWKNGRTTKVKRPKKQKPKTKAFYKPIG